MKRGCHKIVRNGFGLLLGNFAKPPAPVFLEVCNMVYVTGDMHGDDARWYDRQLKKLKAGDTLLICGDFGYVWSGSKREKKDLEYLGSRPYAIGFLDGTHENFDLLRSYRQTVWNGGRVHRISGNLFHLIRGQIFTIEGQRFFVFGGGESPDKEIRLEQHSWWRDELPSPAEMAEGAENLDEAGLKVDYILTHEPPSMVKSAVLLRAGKADRVSKLNGYLEEIDRACTFRHWYFGSIHEDRTVTPRHTALFRRIIQAGEDLSNTEDNNFFRAMLGGRRAAKKVMPTAPAQSHKPDETEEKKPAIPLVKIIESEVLPLGQNKTADDSTDIKEEASERPENMAAAPVEGNGALKRPAAQDGAVPAEQGVVGGPSAAGATTSGDDTAAGQTPDTIPAAEDRPGPDNEQGNNRQAAPSHRPAQVDTASAQSGSASAPGNGRDPSPEDETTDPDNVDPNEAGTEPPHQEEDRV